MSDDHDHTIATATVTGAEKPYGVRIDAGGHALRADEPVNLNYIIKDRNVRWLDRQITLHGVDDDQRAKLAEIAEKTPVTRAVRAGTEIRTTTGAA